MKLFLDTADINEISELNQTGLVDGITTNPSLIAKSGRNIIEAIEETFIIDENLSIRKAIDLLWNLRDIDLDNIKKHTLPTYPYELEDGRQVLIMEESFKEFAISKGILDF